MKLYIDTETYSETPITSGTYRYTADCECMLVTYAIDDGPVEVWDCTQEMLMPDALNDALESPDVQLIAHNSVFDRNVIKSALGYDIPIERWRCTMVRAMSHGLPGSLDKLSDIFKLGDSAKHKTGRALILLFCKPNKGVRNTYATHPEQWRQFLDYAKSDISAMRRLDSILPKWNSTERELAFWFLDQRANDRGVAIDVDLAKAALRAVNKEQCALKARTKDLTEGELESTSQRDATLTYMLEAYGVSLPDLQMATVQRRIDDPDLPIELKELLQIRLQVSTTSTSKYKAMLKAANDDGRVRGLIQFCGAIRSGRDAGRNIQVQNFPSRGLMPYAEVELGIRLLKQDSADLVFDNIMALTSSALRPTLIAPEGKKLIAADLSNIEGRYLAWAAGEAWKVQAFKDFDAGIGHDLYALAYAKSFHITPEEVMENKKHGDGSMRQVGKTLELSMGYAGGVGAFLTFANAYGIDLEAMGETAYDTIDATVLHEAKGFYDWTVEQMRSTFGLSERAFIVCESFKRLWRQAHPATVALWGGLYSIVKQAILTPSSWYTYGKFKARRDGQWLRIIMPSGRNLCFPYPQVDEKGAISFMGINQYSRNWERVVTHGGKLVENCTQAGARDVFKHGTLRADEEGYPLVFPVHDENVTEVPDTEDYSAERLSAIMSEVPDWAGGLPLAAEGFETKRYRK